MENEKITQPPVSVSVVQQTPPVSPTSSKSSKRLMILVILFFIIAAVGIVAYVLGAKTQTPQPVKPTPLAVTQPTPTPDPTADWKTYSSNNISFSYPSTWKVEEKMIEGTTTFLIKKGDGDANYNTTIYLGSPEIFSTSGAIDGNEPYIKNAGNAIFSIANKNYSPKIIELEKYMDGKPTGQKYYRFQQEIDSYNTITVQFLDMTSKETVTKVLSTLKFIDQIEKSPLTSPTANPAKKLNYLLPTGWKTVQDKTGTFEIGYNPETDLIFGPSSINDLNIGLTKVGQYGGSSYNLTIQPYDGGSRHNFILGPSGIQEQDKMADYHEKNYTYNGWSCLVLYGVSISQWPSTQGMCVIDSKRAFAFGMWKNEAATEQIIQTIKLLK